MTLEKHIIDTMKEWQMKMGSLEQGVELFYPKKSLCGYLGLEEDIPKDKLTFLIEKYLNEKAPELGKVEISYKKDRFCVKVAKEGCTYVETRVGISEFLSRFLDVLKKQSMEEIIKVFKEYAREHHTTYQCEKEEDGLGTVFFFADDQADPYVYCVEEDGFGITYHRFTKNDYQDL